MDLKIKDVAELLNVSETTIRRWLQEGKIPAYRLNHQIRFSKIEIENWVMSCKMQGHKASEEASSDGGGMHKFGLFRAVHKGILLKDVEGKTKEEIIEKAMLAIAPVIKVDAELITELLLDRERLMPTALNHGIAVPHTRDFLMKEAYDAIAIVYPKEPIDYGALDGEKVHTLFFLFACQDKSHLHLLAKLAHLASYPENLKFFQTKPDKDLVLEWVKNWEKQPLQLAIH